MKALTYILLVCGALTLVGSAIMAQTALTNAVHTVATGSRPTPEIHTDTNTIWALPPRDKVNEGTVTILSAPVGGVTAILASDMARVLDADELRVLQVAGKGPVQNVIDILDLKSIDMGAVVSDVPEFFKLQYGIPDIALRPEASRYLLARIADDRRLSEPHSAGRDRCHACGNCAFGDVQLA